MKLLVISYFDDNFGDMLIRICFERILRIVLKNLNIKNSDYTMEHMPLKHISEEKIAESDLVFLAGGALFGLSYLNSFGYLDTITKIAEANRVPVIFSSLGINNMDVTEENEQQLFELLKRSCIKSVSVRENPELFRHYAKDCSFEIVPVCDPAVWAKHIYAREIQNVLAEKKSRSRKTVGINVVRGGLFKANNIEWDLKNEEVYLFELKKLLEAEGVNVCFFTNGSTLDNNSMGYFAQKYDIPDEQLVYPHTTREVVEAIAGFDAVIAIRMHASIISYALDIPSVDLVWNDKIPFFYKNIGYPNRAMPIEECTPELVFEKAKLLLADTDYAADQNYLMSLYKYLYNALSDFLQVEGGRPYTFKRIARELALYGASLDDDIIDYRMKIDKGEHRYLSLFKKNKAVKKQIKNLNSENAKLKEQTENLNSENENLKEQTENLNSENEKLKEQTENLNLENAKLKEQAENLNSENEKLKEQTENLNSENGKLKDQAENLNLKNEKLKKQVDDQKKKIAEVKATLAETNKKLTKTQQISAKRKERLDRIDSKFFVKAYRKLRRILLKLIKKK